MRTFFLAVIYISLSAFVIHPCFAGNERVFFREDFSHLENWRPLYFPKIKKHTTYSVETDMEGTYLKSESHASASAIVFKEEFDVHTYPRARWRWKISNVYEAGNALEKAGDDYPVRIYIIFKYDPQTASFGKKLKYGVAKKIYGEYPPDSSLNYIWANRDHVQNVLTNTYADEAKMVVLQAGENNAGKWLEEEVNILEDYRKIFGIEPPAVATIAIMNDSDNTGEESTSFVDYIEVFR